MNWLTTFIKSLRDFFKKHPEMKYVAPPLKFNVGFNHSYHFIRKHAPADGRWHEKYHRNRH